MLRGRPHALCNGAPMDAQSVYCSQPPSYMVQRDATRAQYYDNAMQAVEGLTAGRAIEQAYSFAWNAALPGFLRALQVCRTAYIVVIISTTTTTTIDLPHAAAATPPRGRPPHRRHPSSRRLRSLPACAPQGSRDAGAGRPGGGSGWRHGMSAATRLQADLAASSDDDGAQGAHAAALDPVSGAVLPSGDGGRLDQQWMVCWGTCNCLGYMLLFVATSYQSS